MKFRQLITLLCPILLFFASCNEKMDLPQPSPHPTMKDATNFESIPLEFEWSDAPFSLEKSNFKFAGNIRYDKHRRNKFDIIVPNSDAPTPLVIYIHGGGFTRGDKNSAYIHTDTIRNFLASGIAFATINYRYLDQTEDGVRSSLEDCKKLVQYVRHYAESFNIDKEKIAGYGPSAGGGAALWLGTHDDLADPNSTNPIERQSTRLSAVVALGTQSTYDLVRWEEIFSEHNFSLSDPEFDPQTLYKFYVIDSLAQLNEPHIQRYRKEVDMLGLMSVDDAPIYVNAPGKALPPKDILDLYHHPFHALALKEKAKEVGLKHIIVTSQIEDANDMGPVQFIIEQFEQ